MYYCFDFYLVIFLLTTYQILVENRYKHNQYNDCLLSIDGWIFKPSREAGNGQIQEVGCQDEVALSILGREICWIKGPNQPGVYNDLEIF
jgi:hypothetical protein